MTARDIIKSALRQIGQYAVGETPTDQEAFDGLTCLNDMVDAWNSERLFIFTNNRVSFTLPSGQQTRTLGPSGQWNMARPAKIDEMSVVVNNIEYPVDYFTEEAEWQAIWLKNVTSSWPSKCWDDSGFPLRTLSFWPIPNTGDVTVVFYPWVPLSSFASLNTNNTFPPGYAEAIKYNLALRLAVEFPGQVIPDALPMLAAEAKGRIKSANIPRIDLSCDPAAAGDRSRQGSTGVVSSAGFNSGYYPWW